MSMSSMSGMSASSGDASSSGLTPVNPADFDLHNDTQAMDFLGQMLDDSVLQFDAKDFSQYFWYGIVSFICVVSFYNLLWRANLRLRKRTAAAGRPKPATSKTIFGRCLAATSNICRKVTYMQFTSVRSKFWLQLPPFGIIILLLTYVSFVLALEFINNHIAGAQYWTSLGIRAGWLAIAQTPLLILLAGKNNLIGVVTGISFERLNILHRWVARGVLLMAILHVGYQNYGWHKYGVRSMEWATDLCPPTGMGAFALLLWLNLSTMAPIRNFSYELFVFQHLVTFFGFIIAIMIHLPTTAIETRVYIWIPIGLYLFDRLLRTARSVWHNSRPGRATICSIDGEVSRILVKSSRVKNWAPGSHVLLSIPHFGIAQSHPATIASAPRSHGGDLLFILRAHRGFTKKLLSTANKSTTSLTSEPETEPEKGRTEVEKYITFIDGPYGGSQGDFAAFDTVCLIAGSTGITFTLSILLDIAQRVGTHKLPIRRIELVWAVKRIAHMTWVADELEATSSRLLAAGIESKFRVFVTCDDSTTDSHSSTAGLAGCRCNTAKGQPCCCTSPQSDPICGPSEAGPDTASRHPREHTMSGALTCVETESGRPNFSLIMPALLAQAQGEMGVAVCGPLGLSTAVRRTVAQSMTASKGIYLHVEGFSW